MLLPELLDDKELVALHNAFAKACIELGIGPDEAGRDRREHLASLMFALSKDGESDPDVIRAQAVHRMRPPAAGLFHQ